MRLNRKWILVIALVVSMATAISGTLAYLQDSVTAKNTFTVGNVDIDLFEEGWVDGSTPALLPGVEITKKPYIVNNKNNAWVWMKVTVPNDLMSYIDWNSEGGWTMTNDEDADNDGYTIVTMKWPNPLTEGGTTAKAFTRVLLDASLKEMPASLVNDNGTIDIVVEAYAIQTADAYDSIDEAIAAYGTNGEPGEGGNEPEDSTSVSTYEQLVEAIKKGGNIVLDKDITVDEWVMFSETLSIGNGNIITVDKIDVSIDGAGHTLTVNSIESAGNGNKLFHAASNLNISNLTIKFPEGAHGIGLNSGVISNVSFEGGTYAIQPGNGDIKIEGCTFANKGTAIYFEEERDNLTVTGCTFNQPEDANVILLRGDVKFTNNTVNSGRTVNIVSGSPVVTGNNFNNVRLKVYSAATATVSNNTINNLAFETATYSSTFGENNLSAEAQAALNAVTRN